VERYIWTACPACLVDDPAGCLMLGYGVGDIYARCRHCEHCWWWQSGEGIGGLPYRLDTLEFS